MRVYSALQWTGIPSLVYSYLTPSVSGTSVDSDQDKVLTKDEYMNEVMNMNIFSLK